MTNIFSQQKPILSSEVFLQEYWQQKSCYLPGALADFESPIDANDLAGLALEDEVESRIIVSDKQPPEPDLWQLRHGPFNETDFQQLDAQGATKNWSLLVQAVDHWVPEVKSLLELFQFIPNWRIDDIMVSYAPTGGSVGPHFDYYDVFFLQGEGRREWRLGDFCNHNAASLTTTELSILAEFETRETIITEPGDLLYLPARQAHWGISLDDTCLTYSIGFRAPSVADMLDQFATHICMQLADDMRYEDPKLELQTNPGEINSAALDRLHALTIEALTDKNAFQQWFGRYVTTPKYAEPGLMSHLHGHSQDTLKLNALDAGDKLEDSDLRLEDASADTQEISFEKEPASRFSYILQHQHIDFFVDGQHFECSLELQKLVEHLCKEATLDNLSWKQLINSHETNTQRRIEQESRALLATLAAQNSLIIAQN